MSEDTVIAFRATIRLPDKGKFPLKCDLVKDPQKFVKGWLEGAVSNIYEASYSAKDGAAPVVTVNVFLPVKYETSK